MACLPALHQLLDDSVDDANRGGLEQVADSAKVLQAILAAGANQRGEWDLPLSAEAVPPLPPHCATPSPPCTPGKHSFQQPGHAGVPATAASGPPASVPLALLYGRRGATDTPRPYSKPYYPSTLIPRRAQADAMRREVAARKGELDEALLSNAFAWMRKAADDRLDGMVALLQKVGRGRAAEGVPGGQVQDGPVPGTRTHWAVPSLQVCPAASQRQEIVVNVDLLHWKLLQR